MSPLDPVDIITLQLASLAGFYEVLANLEVRVAALETGATASDQRPAELVAAAREGRPVALPSDVAALIRTIWLRGAIESLRKAGRSELSEYLQAPY